LILQIVRILAGAYFGLLLIVFFGQRKFIYHPSRDARDVLEKYAGAEGFQAWQNHAGQFIGWKKINASSGARQRLLIVHGNAGSAIDRLNYANELESLKPLDVYVLEYPGYGPRPGSPSQKSLFQAADEAVTLIKEDGPFYVIGESLGTGVACYLAGTYPESIRGMLLLAPYDNLTDVGQCHMPLFPVKWLLLDRFPSSSYLKNYHGPVAVLVAGRDVVVPMRFGRKLYDGYEGPKQIWESSEAGHDDLLDQSESWWRDLVAFWDQKSVGFTASGGDVRTQIPQSGAQ
jgi:hypothetical protein